MAIQFYVGGEIDPDISTFEGWMNMTNSMITDMGSDVITTGNNNIGNTEITGTFSADVIAASGSLRGGDMTTPGPLTITSNTDFTGTNVTTSATTVLETLGNVNLTGATRTFVVDNASTTISSVNMTVNANTIFNGTVNFSSDVTANNVTITGTLSAADISFTGLTTLVDLSVSGNTSILNLEVTGAADFEDIFAQNVTVAANTATLRLSVSGVSTLANTTITNLTVSANTVLAGMTATAGTITTLTAPLGTITTLTSTTGTITTLNATTTTSTNLTVSGTGAMRIPVGATVQRPATLQNGLIRYNTTLNKFEGYGSAGWEIISDTLDTVAGTGYIVKTADGTVTRSISSGSGILVTDPSGVAAATSIATDFATNTDLHAGTANKSISASILYTSSESVIQSIGTSSFTPNLNAGRNFLVDLTGNRTINNPTNQKAGQKGMIIVRQDSAGGRVLTYGAHFKFSGGVSTLSTVPNAIDVISYYVLESGTILCTITRGF